MKVLVTLTEVVTYEITKEVEISKEDYATYIKTGKLPNKKNTELNHDLSSDIDSEHWVSTQHEITEVKK